MKKFNFFFYVMIFGFCCFAKMFSLLGDGENEKIWLEKYNDKKQIVNEL